MKKPPHPKKLPLTTSTIRVLDADKLAKINGGIIPTNAFASLLC